MQTGTGEKCFNLAQSNPLPEDGIMFLLYVVLSVTSRSKEILYTVFKRKSIIQGSVTAPWSDLMLEMFST